MAIHRRQEGDHFKFSLIYTPLKFLKTQHIHAAKGPHTYGYNAEGNMGQWETNATFRILT
jgi:YD repeat-containing protein